MSTLQKRLVRCPQCGKDAEWSEANPYRPFCSARCKQIDLGAWASEQYRMPCSPLEDGNPSDSATDSTSNRSG